MNDTVTPITASEDADPTDQASNQIYSARSTLDLIAMLGEHKGIDSLQSGTLTGACLTAIQHLDDAIEAIEEAALRARKAAS